MASGTMTSRVAGLVRDAVIGALFSRLVSDAFVVAFRLPNMFRRILGEGSLSVSFLPIYVEAQERGQDEEARKLASAVYTFLIIITGTLSVIGIIFMPQFMNVLVSGEGYQSVPGKMEVTILLSRISFGFVFLVTMYAYFMAICQAHGKYLVGGMAQALFNVTIIVFAFIPGQEKNGIWLAWGSIVGGIGQAGLCAWTLYELGHLPKLTRHVWILGVKRVLTNMAPSVLGMGVLQLMGIVNVYFASILAQGSHSYIYWGDRVLELPQALVAVSLGSAMLPRMSAMIARGNPEQVSAVMLDGLRALLFLCMPAAAGMYALALPITEVLFFRGQFTAADADAVASILRIYSFLLIASSFVRVLVTGFYARQNTWFPGLAATVVFLAHLVFASMGVKWAGLSGLVTATVLSGFLNGLLLILFFNRMVVKLHWLSFFKNVAPMVFPTVMMGLFAQTAGYALIAGLKLFLPLILAQILSLGVAIALSGVLYFYFCILLKIPEAKETLKRLAGHLPNGKLRTFLTRFS